MWASYHEEQYAKWEAERAGLNRALAEANKALLETEMAAPLYAEHGELTEKIFTGGLSDEEKKRLEFVRDQLDVLETRRGSQWDRLNALIEFHRECFTVIVRLIKRDWIDEMQNVDRACEVAERALKEKP